MSGGKLIDTSNPRGSRLTTSRYARTTGAMGLGLLIGLSPATSEAQLRKIGEMELRLSGLSATVENAAPVVPKHTPGGIRVLVRAGGVDVALADLTRFLGPNVVVEGELSGPGFSQPVALPLAAGDDSLVADPLVLRTPPIPIAGSYRLSNLRVVANGRPVLDVDPSTVPLRVIDQILVTQVSTRALTLDEIRGKGIVLDSDDYLGFEFTMGFKLESKAIDLKFPVVFDRQGVAIPQPLSPPAAPMREGVQLPTIMPLLLEVESPTGVRETLKFTTPSGVVKPITIPAVLVIPGNVGYLKQFFSAQLYVSNGAPVGSGLNVRDIKASLKLPPGADLELGTLDDPLALPELERDGRIITQPLTAEVRGLGPDETPQTADDVDELAPAEQGQAEFLIRGEQEGFHQIQFDLTASLLGLPIGPVTVKGKAAGGVLVRNPYFNVTFTVPSVVRVGERFKMRATVTNIGKGIGNDVSMTLDSSRMSGLVLEGDATKSIPTLKPGDARLLEFDFVAQRNGKVVATYLKFDTQSGSTGRLNFTIGVGERNVPLSPDTLVLPASTAGLPDGVVDAAMRVLGQAWSLANAPSGTLPAGVIRVNGQVVVKKALALAEAGLRVTLGQSSEAAVRDLLSDFFSGTPVDPGFDQLLRTTEAGDGFVQAVGAALENAALQQGGGQGYEFAAARLLASSGSFISFGWDGVPGDLSVVDGAGRTTIRSTVAMLEPSVTGRNVVSAVLVPLGSDRLLGLLLQPTAGPYRWEFRAASTGLGQFSITFERADGSYGRASWSGSLSAGSVARISTEAAGGVTVALDEEADGVFERTESVPVNTLPVDGPQLVAAAVIGPETLDGAGPWGFQTALVFDRVVSEASAALVDNYTIPANSVRSARRQLSGRLVFAGLTLPEGPYVPSRVTVHGIGDSRGAVGPEATTTFTSRLEDFGAVVSGRVLGSEGEPLADRSVVYYQNLDLSCSGSPVPSTGLAAPVTGPTGAFELRYVRQDQCGAPFQLHTVDPSSGARRTQSLRVIAPGQQIVADFVMLAAGSASGTVKNLTGQPVPGANVVVLSQTETQVGGSAVTDALGRYSVSGITVGPVVVRAGKGNGVGSAAGRIDRPNVPAVIDVTLDGGSVSVTGVVRKVEDGVTSPAVGAVVTYSLLTPTGAQVMAVAATDATGQYAFTGLPVGAFSIRAEANTRDRATITGEALAGDELLRDISVEIPPTTALGFIEGHVVMPDGARAPGVIVSVGAASVLSGEAGTFRIPVYPALSAQVVIATTRDRKRSGRTSVLASQPGETVVGAVITLSGLGAAEFTVLDTLGQPLVGRSVRLLDSMADPCGRSEALTDALGRARFTDLGLGAVIGQVVNEGDIVDAVRGSISVSGDGQTGFGILRVETRASSVAGIVVDGQGQPVFGADVELISSAFVVEPLPGFFCGMKSMVTHRARTGTDGRFAFSGLHPGRVYVSARQDFSVQVSRHLDLQPAEAGSVVLTLADSISGKISGHVFEPDGITSAGGGVEVTLNGALPDVTVFTDAAGYFQFARIFPAGSYQLTARDPITGNVERSTIYIAASVDAVHDVRLKGKTRVRVKVTDALAQAVSQAYVTLKEIAFPSRVFEGVVAPSNQGQVEFPGVFEGAVSIEVRDSFGRGGRSSLTIPTGISRVDAVVRLSTTGVIRGRFVMPDGAPIPLGGLKLFVANRLIGQVTASADNPPGGFEFAYVPAGAFRLEALDPLSGRTGLAVGSIESEGQLVEIDVQAQSIGSVSGVVTSNGWPLAGARVDLVSGGYSAATTTDSLGRYLVQGVPEGRVVVSAYTGNGFLRASVADTLQGEGAALALDVALRDTGVLSGQVYKAGGVDRAGVVGVSLSVGGAGGGSITGSTDEDGAFVFDRVPAGLAYITIDALGTVDFATGTFEVLPGEETQATLILNGIGDLKGRGVNSVGDPTPGRLLVQVGPPLREQSFYVDLPADGRFLLPRVLAGAYTATLITTTAGIALYGTATGTVVDGQVADFEIRLQDSGTVVGRVLRADGLTPAYGSTVTLDLPGGGRATTQAQADGSFLFRGVGLGGFTVSVVDPVTTGVARATGLLAANGGLVDLGALTLDDSSVQVVSVDPLGGAVAVQVQQPVRVTFSDPLVGTTGVRVLNAGIGTNADITLSADGRVVSLTPKPAWPDARELTIQATTAVTDVFGRRLAQTFTSTFVTQDMSPPSVAGVVPAYGAIQVDPGASLTINFSEPLAASSDLTTLVRLNRGGEPAPGLAALVAPNTVTFVPESPLAINATYSIQVLGARDLSGNAQTAPFDSFFKTLDTVAPGLLLQAPTAGGWTTNRRPQIALALTDNLSGVDPFSGALALDGAPAALSPSAVALSFVPATDLSDGLHTLTASVKDKAGNKGLLEATFRVDATPPTPAGITSGVVPGAVVGGVISLSASSFDATSGLARIDIMEAGFVHATLLPPTFTSPLATTGLAEGAHVFTARAVDVAGNMATLGPAVPFFVDNSILTLAVTAPTNGLRIRDSVTASASTSEPVARVVFSVGDTLIEDTATPHTAVLDTSSLPEGNHTVLVTAYALTGEPTTATVSVFVDRTPPFDPVTGLLIADDQGNGLAQVSGRSGAIVGGTSVEIRVFGASTTVNASVAADGSFATRIPAVQGDSVEVRALDSVGNISNPVVVPVTRSANPEGVPLRALAMWLRADAGVTTDGSGMVTQWADQSAAANNLVQPTATRQPTFLADGFEGHPVLRFDGNSDVLEFSQAIPVVRTVFWVVKESSSANTATRRNLLGSTTSPGDFRGGLQATTTSIGPIWGEASARVKTGSTFVNGAPVDGTVFPRPRAMSVISLTTAEGTTSVTANRLGAYEGTSEFWWGDLAEMLVYSEALTDGERVQVENYLARKYRPYVPAAGAPRITPPGKVFGGSTAVEILAEPGATVRYTTDGSEPGEDAAEYLEPFTVETTTTVKARAFMPSANLNPSAVATATFIEAAQGPPTSQMALWVRADAGLVTNVAYPSVWVDQSVNGNHLVQSEGTRLPRLVPGVGRDLPVMRFDGNSDFLKFTSRLSRIQTVFSVIREDTSATSDYRHLLGDATTYDFLGGAGAPGSIWDPTYAAAAVKNGLTLLNGAPVDGTVTKRPRVSSVLSLVTTGDARADRLGQDGMGYGRHWWGDVAELIIYEGTLGQQDRLRVEGYLSAKYEIGGKAITPRVSPAGGLFSNEVEVSLSTPTPGATIRYTLDGTDPTPSAGEIYAGPFKLSATATVKARAFKDLSEDSAVAIAGFTKDSDTNPKSVAIGHLALWWRADAGVPSGAGEYWADQSGSLNHGIQPSSSAAATLVPNAVNGLPALRFDGKSDFIRFSKRLTNIRTVFFVVREDPTATADYRHLLGDVTGYDFIGGSGAPGSIWDPTYAAAGVRGGATFLNGFQVNGTTTPRPRVMSLVSLVTSADTIADRFGQDGRFGNRFWWGDLAELVIYDRALSAPERLQIETYLKGKYAIP